MKKDWIITVECFGQEYSYSFYGTRKEAMGSQAKFVDRLKRHSKPVLVELGTPNSLKTTAKLPVIDDEIEAIVGAKGKFQGYRKKP